MALKAGYYGVKKNILDELEQLDGILPAGVSKNNKLVAASTIGDLSKLSTENKASIVKSINEIVGEIGYLTTNIIDTAAIKPDWSIGSNGSGSTNENFNTYIEIPVMENKSYTIGANFTVESGSKNLRVHGYNANMEWVKQLGYKAISTSGDQSLTVTTETGIHYIQISAPKEGANYYMYNVDTIIADLTNHKTAINAIIAAATEAADFAAFKTAMGAITPVTRSLSIQAPETRSSDPEPEPETKTTKRSTKKTETTE